MHESDGPLPGAARRPDQPDGSGRAGGCLLCRLRGHAAADLGVGEHAAADREPARAPPAPDVGPLVQHPGHRRRERLLELLLLLPGGRVPRAGLPLPGEAAERVQVPGPHRRQVRGPRPEKPISFPRLSSLLRGSHLGLRLLY
jgi:hypothetical protein